MGGRKRDMTFKSERERGRKRGEAGKKDARGDRGMDAKRRLHLIGRRWKNDREKPFLRRVAVEANRGLYSAPLSLLLRSISPTRYINRTRTSDVLRARGS